MELYCLWVVIALCLSYSGLAVDLYVGVYGVYQGAKWFMHRNMDHNWLQTTLGQV